MNVEGRLGFDVHTEAAATTAAELGTQFVEYSSTYDLYIDLHAARAQLFH